MLQPTEDCARCNHFVAMVCDEEGAFGRPCDNTIPPAGADASNGDSTGPGEPPQLGTGHLAAPDAMQCSPAIDQPANPAVPPYSETCPGCAEAQDPCHSCPRRAAQHGNLELAREEGRCPTSPVGCRLDPAWAETAEGAAVCRACIGAQS